MDEVEKRLLEIEKVENHFLRRAEFDQEQARLLQVERARLTLYGSLAILAAAVTAVMGTEKSLSIWAVGTGLMAVFCSVMIAWNGLHYAEMERLHCVSLHYLELKRALNERFGANDALFPPLVGGELEKTRRLSLSSSQKVRSCTLWSSILTTFGVAILLSGVISTVGKPVKEVPATVSIPSTQSQQAPAVPAQPLP